MASGYQCDRCGVWKRDTMPNQWGKGFPNTHLAKAYDLCPPCHKEALRFFANLPTTAAPPPVSEPKPGFKIMGGV